MYPIWLVVSNLQPLAESIFLIIPHIVGGGPLVPWDVAARALPAGVCIPGLLPVRNTAKGAEPSLKLEGKYNRLT